MIKREVTIGDCRLIQGDCSEVMPMLDEFDAVVTDPPYGIGADKAAKAAADQRIKADGKSKAGKGWKDYGDTDWDSEPPPAEFFEAIRSKSKEQIIWGGNYFTDNLPPTMQWLVWDKGQRGFSLADCEFAWSSRWAAARIFDYSRGKALRDGKVHPTQKPVELMEWCIKRLQKGTNNILDPFMGSGTTGVACVKLGRKFTGIELNPDYFDIACERIQKAYDQPDMFIESERQPEPRQEKLL